MASVIVIGNVNVDLVMGPQAPWPRPGTEVLLPDSDLRVGGAAGNVALALKALGTPHRLVASRGDDVLGRWLAEAFEGGADAWAVSASATTVSVGITHPDGERTFFTSAGHLASFTLADVLDQVPARATPGDVACLVGMFVCPVLAPDYLALVQVLKARNFAVALDTGWPDAGWTDSVRADVRALLPSCDHLMINEIEAQGLAGRHDLHAAAEVLAAELPPGAALLVKRGPAGAWGFAGGAVVKQPAPRVDVVDTIGAGDAFNGGYLSAILAGRSMARAVEFGVRLASLAVSTRPRRYGSLTDVS